MTKVRIVAAVVDTRQLTLYKEDGNVIRLAQGDPRLKPILDQITPILAQNLVAEIDLESENAYRKFEEKSGGLVRFFRVAKKAVASIFGGEPEEEIGIVEPTTVGTLPQDQGQVAKAQSAVADIMAHAKPVTAEDYLESEHTTSDTMIAVVQDAKGMKKVIPEVENLKDQFSHAAKLGSTIGVENFLKRIAAVIDERGHSVQDLLRFMERGDLPIADDGSIIIYKALNKKGDTFVDLHSGNVPQNVGSHVRMDPSMVDPNRRNECSNGLHVARRGYLNTFGGTNCFLAKVAPEDVIAVPNYDANKMRVCGYHILFKLSDEDYATLKANRPMTEKVKAQILLGRAIKGDHEPPTEEVRITGHRGTGIVVTPLLPDGTKKPKLAGAAPKAKAIESEKTLSAAPVDPSAIAKTVNTAKGTPTRQQEAQRLWALVGEYQTGAKQKAAAEALLAFKKKAKVGWSVLGLEEMLVNIELKKAGLLEKKPATKQEEAAPAVTPAVVAESVDEPAPKKVPAKTPTSKPKANTAPAPTTKKEPVKMTGTRAEVARKLFDQAAAGDKASWGQLWLHRKECKKGWDLLGFTPKEIERIKLNKPDWV